ncbi:hypothetical protein PHMEG_00019791, partial [Phytophthora megakarya]
MARRAQTLEVCRAKASVVENVDRHYNNVKAVMASLVDIPTSRIWNFDETGMCPQTCNSKKKVLAATNMRAHVQESNDRTNISALVCVNVDGGYVPPVFILPRKKIRSIPPDRPVLVIADGYKCHFSSGTLQYARKHDIHLYALPAHTSHFFRLLDVSVYHHFKRLLEDEKSVFRVKERHMVE